MSILDGNIGSLIMIENSAEIYTINYNFHSFNFLGIGFKILFNDGEYYLAFLGEIL